VTAQSKDIKAMADLLKQGATLTELSCPACASPLFKLRSGDLWCAKCQKRVVIVKEGQQAEEVTKPSAMNSLESTVVAKIQEVEKKLKEETDPQQLEKISNTLTTLLENLERIRKMKPKPRQ
jgi:UPF0148 protein